MLTDEEKSRILEEETYRREVRAGLDVVKPRISRWQQFLGVINSPVFIWFLSSVILGAASFLYNSWSRANAVEDENRRTAKKLDAEIASRLVHFNLLVMQHEGASEAERTKDYYDISKLVTPLENPSAADFPVNVFPEYLNRSLRSLLWELIQVVPENEKKELRRAYQESLQLQVIYLNAVYANRRSTDQGMISAPQARALRESFLGIREVCCVFNLERWGSAFEKLVKKEGWCSPSEK